MDFSIVIPFYNEEDNVEEVVSGIDAVLADRDIQYEIVAVDNGSFDNTGKILGQLRESIPNLKILRIEENQGYGWGIINGLRWTSGNYIGFMCGDNQIEPTEILNVYDKIVTDNLDLCKVRRVKRQDGLFRKLISFFYNIICPTLFLIKATDLNGTQKIFKKSIFENLDLVSKGWFIDAEIMIKFSKAGYKIGDVPVVFKKRRKGYSKINLKAVFSFIKEMLIYRMNHIKI